MIDLGVPAVSPLYARPAGRRHPLRVVLVGPSHVPAWLKAFQQLVQGCDWIELLAVVAADAVGAGVDEMVLYASGSSARQTTATDKKPVDAVVMAIVDQWEIGGDEKYIKANDR